MNGSQTLIAILLGAVLATAGGAAGATAPAAPVRRALLIGINDYATEQYPDLRGALNDVATMREVLVSRFGFAERDVTLLTDAAATRNGILTALDRLAAQSRAGDVVYVHFSGHGSQVEDLDGDEQDGRDETLLPHDARTAGVPDITDDELGAFLARLPAGSAVVTLDSCHSGTATRGAFVTRSVPPDTRIDLYRRAPLTPRGIVPLERPERHVLLTAAAAHQLALDGPAHGRMHGLFTYALSQGLQSAGPGATPSDLYPAIRRTFDWFSDLHGIRVPEPQIEASAERLAQPLFGDLGEAAARPWVAVQPTDGDAARLVKGATLNAQPGSWWAIYPAGNSTFDSGRAIALGRVVALDGADALLQVEPGDAALAAGFRAVLAAPAATEELRVALTGLPGLPRDRAAALRRVIERHAPDVTFVDSAAVAHVLVECAAAACDVRDVAGVALLERVATDDLDAAGARLAERFNRALNAATLLALSNPLSTLRLDVALVGPGPDVPRNVWRTGTPLSAANSLVLDVRASRDCWLTIVDVDAEGGINVLFPTPHAEPGFWPDGFVPAGTTVRIPDSLARDNAAGFHWPFVAPAGSDTIQVFAATDRETATLIRQRVATAGAPPARSVGAAPDGSGRRGLDALRAALAGQMLQRGAAGPGPRRPAGEWTSAAVRVQIVE